MSIQKNVQRDEGNRTVMHWLWKWAWTVWFLALISIGLTLLTGFTKHIYVLYAYAVFAPMEAQGAIRRRWSDDPKGMRVLLGDTHSEWMWWITDRLPARHQFSKMIAWFHGVNVYLLFYLVDDGQWTIDDFTILNVIISVPWAMISVGVAKWLEPHFEHEGDEG